MSFLNDKTAVVTGAGGTLCSVLSVCLAREGANVVLIGRTPEKLEKTAAQIRELGKEPLILPCDVNDEAAVAAAAQRVKEVFGGADYLLNGAGGNSAKAVTKKDQFTEDEFAPEHVTGFFDLDTSEMERVLLTNTMGTLIPCRVFGRQMAEKGAGAIVNFASMNTYKPLTKNVAYAMAKAAVSNFTEWLANYLAPAGIRVNAVAPGFFVNERSVKILRTPDGGLSERGEHVFAHTPMKRFGEAPDLWGCVEWLLNDEKSGFVTGITVPVDGGFSAHPGI